MRLFEPWTGRQVFFVLLVVLGALDITSVLIALISAAVGHR